MTWLEYLSQKATDFVSSHWGTLAAIGVIAVWLVSIPLLGASRAWGLVDKVIFATSFLLLFLLQRSQTKATLSIPLKLNELLASAHRASPQMINIEDKSEEEVRELHDRFQAIQQKGLGSHSIDDTAALAEKKEGSGGAIPP
jgi:low affinity Fe/Cu permease